MNRVLKIAISPCPNDTFIFGHWIQNMLHAHQPAMLADFFDIQQLNRLATTKEYDLIKVSAAHMLELLDDYQILDAGAALGLDCGPLMVISQSHGMNPQPSWRIAVPGMQTTARFLLNHAFPELKNLEEVVFHDIEQAVASNRFDAGIIIHESRFTYLQKGLVCLSDLGQVWYQKTKLPIPLGLIAVRRELPGDIKQNILQLVRASVSAAWTNDSKIKAFICHHAQSMEETIVQQHILTYVNSFSYSLKETGKQAIERLMKIQSPGIRLPQDLYIE